MRLGLYEIPGGVEIGDEGLSALVSVHALVFSGVGIHRRVVVHDLYLLEVMPLPDEEVVRVMGGGNLHAPGPEAYLNVVVGYHGDLAPDERKYKLLSDKVLCRRVVRVDGYRRVAEHGLRAGRRYLDKLPLLADYRVLYMPEKSGLVLILDLRVRERGAASRAPVYNSVSAVNKSLFVERDKHLAHRAAAALIHSEALS